MNKLLRRELWISPDVFGFAAHWAWIWCVFWSALFYGESWKLPDLALAPSTHLEPLWVVSLFMNVVSIGALLFLARHRNPLSEVRWLPYVCAFLTAVGTFCISHFSHIASAETVPAFYLAGSVLTGLGSGGIVMLWAERFAELPSWRVVHFFVRATLVAILVSCFCMIVPSFVAQALATALPLVGMGFYLHQRRQLPSVPRKYRNVRIEARLPVLMIVVAFFFGLSFGAMKALIAPAGDGWINLRDALNIVAIALGTVAIYVTSAVFKMDFDHLTYQVALPLMAAGFLFLPMHEPWSVVGTAVHQMGYQYFYIVLWALWAALVAREHVPAAWIAGWGLLAIQGGQLLGSIGADLCLVFIHGDLGKAMLSAFVIFVILLVSLFVFGNRSANTGWGFIKPMEQEQAEDSARSFDEACEVIAHRYRLTTRENDVFLLLARGRNRAYIRDELVIGDETVKSHIKSIYRKCEVHSQQALINLVDRERAEERLGE